MVLQENLNFQLLILHYNLLLLNPELILFLMLLFFLVKINYHKIHILNLIHFPYNKIL